jgi:endoglucanase
MTVRDRSAAGGRALALGRGSLAAGSASLPGPVLGVLLRARTGSCAHVATLALSVDGARSMRVKVSSRRFRDHRLPVRLAAGRHSIAVAVGRSGTRCARAVQLDRLAFVPAPVLPAAGSNPFASAPLYSDGGGPAAAQASAWRSSRPADAAQMDKIAAQPQAVWFGDWNDMVHGDVSGLLDRAAAAGRLPVLVAYDLPNLDCGGYSAGGAASSADYQRWIRDFAAGIGDRQAAVILEPDALAELDCLPADQRASYVSLLSDAIGVLGARPGVTVYVDAGNSAWRPADEMARRLAEVGAQRTRGLALNVSNFQSTASSIAYGKQISDRLGGLHLVIDTSRNGNGAAPGDSWCNPPGRALGAVPTARTDDPAVDAYLWIKAPGESDGPCNGGPGAGQWWPDYALGLAQRAAY